MKTNQTKPSMPESKRLGGYLTAAVTLGTLASSADAAIVNLDVSSISGPNAGLPPGGDKTVFLTNLNGPSSGSMNIYNAYYGDQWGFDPNGSMAFAVNSITTVASPKNFSASQAIDNTSLFTGNFKYTHFKYKSNTSPDFDSGSYMGFRVLNSPGNYNYGWLEVTWDSATTTFVILGGAYESDLNTAINSGAAASGGGVSGIPEPTNSLCTLGLLVSGIMIRRRGKKAA